MRLSVWGSVAAVALFAGWAAVAEIDQVTRGQGQIIASSRTQVIQAPDSAVIEALFVREGDNVERHQLLAQLDRTKLEAAFLESQAKVAALSATVARLKAEIFGGQPRFGRDAADYPEFRANQLALLRKRRAAIDEELAALERLHALALKELHMTEPLLATGDVSMAEVLRLQRQVAEIEGQATNRRNKYFQECQAEMSKAEEDLAGALQIMIQRRDQLANTQIKAPVKGTVKNVRVTTVGGVLRPGDELMQIVPMEDTLVVEAKVKPADVAFLKPGLDVSVKIDAYDYTIYGSLDGKLTHISADTLKEENKPNEQPYYRVLVETRSPRLGRLGAQDLQLQPGMTATIEVKTGKNTVLKYLLKPVIKTLDESLGER